MGEIILPWALLALCCAIVNVQTVVTMVLAGLTALAALAIASAVSVQMQLLGFNSLLLHLFLVLAGNTLLLNLVRRRIPKFGVTHVLSIMLGVAIAVDVSGFLALREPVTMSLLVAHKVHILLIAMVLHAGAFLAMSTAGGFEVTKD